MQNDDNQQQALNLLIEAYKLYAAFCAIIIAGLLSYSSSTNQINCSFLFLISVGALSLCSILCILGIQYFISEVYHGVFNVYAIFPRIIFLAVMLLIGIGIITGFIFLLYQDKLKIN